MGILIENVLSQHAKMRLMRSKPQHDKVGILSDVSESIGRESASTYKSIQYMAGIRVMLW